MNIPYQPRAIALTLPWDAINLAPMPPLRKLSPWLRLFQQDFSGHAPDR